jgi:hypothetical protein
LNSSDASIQSFGYTLLEKSDMKDWGKVKDLLSRPDILEEIKNTNSVEDLEALAKQLGKALHKVDVVDDAFADTLKGMISNVDNLEKTSKN